MCPFVLVALLVRGIDVTGQNSQVGFDPAGRG
jgi:hypothetical protein